jgi:hypothetical protein
MRFKARYLGILLMIVAAVAVLGWVVMLLWNWVVPALFAGAATINYPHAVGLLILCRVLFGGFRGHRGGRGRRHWEKWAAMSAEERERFLQDRAASSRCRQK